MNEKLSLILRKIIREEIRTELQLFKKELLREISAVSGKQIHESKSEQKSGLDKFPNSSKPLQRFEKRQKPKPKFSNDPFLQSLLEDTEPLESERPEVYMEDFEHGNSYDDLSFLVEEPKINKFNFEEDFEEEPQIQKSQQPRSRRPLVEADIDGRPVNIQNETVKDVLDVLATTDFRLKLKAMESAAKNIRESIK